MRDEDLITAHLSGDLDAGDTLARRYYAALLDYFRLRVPDDQVEELTQHTLLHTIARCDRFRRASSFRHYVYAVARRVVAEHYRRHRHAPDFDDKCEEAPANDTSPSAHVARGQRRARLEHAV
ncbi:MAG: sigma-70 family RNA polymerase sigma factor, partial [Myxococcales bacterium]|nr:sigma-70 family RNA polymerase sigma factor [Myxococcales bacterium]